jgi:hypothetical protein
MANVNGKSYALNVVTPMRPWKSWILRLVFFLAALQSKERKLKQLSLIHFARWVILPRRCFPRVTVAQPDEWLTYDYLFFFSNFSGSWTQYLEVFSAALPIDLNKIWRWSECFPSTIPVTPFKRYVAQMQLETDHYYVAYPQASTTDVKAALEVHDALEDLSRRSDELSPAEFGDAWLEFLVRVQRDLGAPGSAAVG